MRIIYTLLLLLLVAVPMNAQSAQDYLGQVQKDANLTPQDIVDAEEVNTSVGNFGVINTYFQQRHAGIPVHNGLINIHEQNGKLIHFGSRFVSDLAGKVNTTSASISSESAVLSAASSKDLNPQNLSQLRSIAGSDVFNTAGIALENITAELVYLPMENGDVRLTYLVSIYELDAQDWWQINIDAQNGSVLAEANGVVSDSFPLAGYSKPAFERIDSIDRLPSAQHGPLAAYLQPDSYLTYPPPIEAPHNIGDATGAGRTVETNPADLTASPFGWHDTDGVAGPEFTTTQGNNTHAYGDRDGNNSPDTGSQPTSPTNDYAVAIDLTMDPSTYLQGAVANLFYWNNVVHDITFLHGWTTDEGQAQANNYGSPGIGGDHMLTEAQDNADGGSSCNANQATPVDGGNPRQQMFVCLPNDGDFDHGVIAHEHGHSWSIRQTGGAGNSSCLQNSEQMGEGWSDYLALILTIEPGDTGPDSRGIGTWLLDQAPTGPGIRPTPYSTDMSVDPTTYGDIGGLSIPHGVGYAWATMIWDVTWELIDQFGYDPDFWTGTGGNNIALQLVTSGLQLQPCSPGFVDGRDAILAAVDAFNNTNNQQIDKCAIWEKFADRGLGDSADQGSTGSASDGTEAFDMPLVCLQTLLLDMTAAPDPIPAGDDITFTITATNNTTGPITGVQVTDDFQAPALMADITYVSDDCGGSESGGIWTWNIGNMAAAEVQVCNVVATLPATPFSIIDFMDDMETTANWTTSTDGPNGWTNTAAGTGPDGGTQPPSTGSGGNRWFAPDVADVESQILDMVVDVTSNSVSILHAYDTESTFDGGVIEISLDMGATWVDIETAGGVFTANGYNSTISNSWGSPIGGRSAFSGSSGGWITSTIDLTAVPLLATDARLRFLLGTDSSVDLNGWWVDDISMGTQVRICNDANATSNETNPAAAAVDPCPLVINNNLPVELANFSAIHVGGDVVLNWATSSELNNAGFDIEISQESSLWESVGFVEGAGTTNVEQSYTYTVSDLEFGNYSVRLKQIDLDGQFEYSQVRNVLVPLPYDYKLGDSFPNPFNPSAKFELIVAEDQAVKVQMFDMTGRMVQTLYDGMIEANTAKTITINGANLPSGTYIYRATGSTFVSESKSIVLLK